MFIRSFISLFSFYLNGQSISNSEALKSPTFNEYGSMCDLRFNSVTFTDEGAIAFGEQMLRIERSP